MATRLDGEGSRKSSRGAKFFTTRPFAAELIGWFRRHQRALPWRATRDPYRIWVAEIMLQQTRAAAAIPYYERFLQRFPDVQVLARCGEQELLECWSGLGYYSRARNLRRAARHIVSVLDGKLPETYDGWAELPGVGPYTAAAVSSIAFGAPAAVLDGNVARVAARLTNNHGEVRSAPVRQELRQRAQEWLDRRHPGEFNQALMELGATICLPRTPLCPRCPVAAWCEARKLGLQNELPVRAVKRAAERRRIAVAVVQRNGKLLMRRRPRNAALMPGFWELPQAETARPHRDGLGALGLRVCERCGEFRHHITHHEYAVSVFRGTLAQRRPPGYEWVTGARLQALPVTTISRKALAIVRD